ncbi:tetratricopeptide repeat protein [Candidatus Roizmanbacteria bacterium]|nr:tetratricopeptide repeat protein [Candidatus Roizmanbacteria bacterium]
MNEQQVGQISAVLPHKYPWWILLFAVLISLLTIYSIVFVPKYIVAVKSLKAAKVAAQAGNYDKALKQYRAVLAIDPSSRKARIGTAIALFINNDKADDVTGLLLLDGIRLKEDEWDLIKNSIPADYQKYFKLKK